MHIELKRLHFTEKSTIGELYINGTYECFTLEDRVRKPGVKVPKKTCIPFGLYKLILNFSNRFGCEMPLLLAVLNFLGIRIHSGNTADNTEGCILVGETMTTDNIGDSRKAFKKLMPKLRQALKREEVWIEITGTAPPELLT